MRTLDPPTLTLSLTNPHCGETRGDLDSNRTGISIPDSNRTGNSIPDSNRTGISIPDSNRT